MAAWRRPNDGTPLSEGDMLLQQKHLLATIRTSPPEFSLGFTQYRMWKHNNIGVHEQEISKLQLARGYSCNSFDGETLTFSLAPHR
jgi:hypothetical protein